MSESTSKIGQFWQELKRRKVVRVITVYAAAAFVILELVSIIVEPLKLPEWFLPMVIVLLCIGFIIAIILSWIYDIKPEVGIVKTEPAHKAKTGKIPASSNSWRIATYVSAIIITGLVVTNILNNDTRSTDNTELEKSIAVLPFENMNVDEEYSHMGDAFTDEIILELQKIKEFDRVLSRTSTMQYQNNRPTIPEIADKLGVNYIVEGSIQRHKEDVSIRVQVIRAKNEDNVWGDEYDGKWEDIFSIQNEIAYQVANELKTTLSPEEIEQIENTPTENLEAYNLYLRGRYFWNFRTEATLLKAIDFFKQAIQQDSNYALAYTGLADSYIMLPWYAPPSTEGILLAEQAVLKALEINSSIAEAHATLGFIKYSQWEFAAAEDEYLRAIELDSEYATAHHWYAMLLCCTGRYNQAIDEISIARNYDPLSLAINRDAGFIFIRAQQYDNAISALNRVIEIDPKYSLVQRQLARVYSYKGLFENAIFAIQQSEDKIWTGIIDAQMGRLESANQILNELFILSRSRYISPFHLALLYFSLDSVDQGFNSLEEAYEIHELRLTEINFYPEFDEFISDPRYIDLLRKLGLE